MTGRILVVGDVLLDRDISGDVHRVTPDAPVPVVDIETVYERAGGAGLAATLLARDGLEVSLATATADDEQAEHLGELLAGRVQLQPLLKASATRTKTRVRSSGQSLLRMDVDGTVDQAEPPDPAALAEFAAALAQADAVLVSDYAGGVISHPAVNSLLRRWAGRRPMVWDPHPRGCEPAPGVTVVTPNRSEAFHFRGRGSDRLDEVAAALREQWQTWSVAVTDGSKGVHYATTDAPPRFVPAPFEYRGDSCGAGDRFAGTVAAGIGTGSTTPAAIEAAVQDTAEWLAGGGVQETSLAAQEPPELDPEAVIRRVRAAGGTVVATGGCFDVLHAGHIAALQAARQLGDALIVLVNSDESVRRLKGDRRPVNRQADRCQVLRSLRCVDAVMVFADDDPRKTLDRLRPDIWVKGGDYTADMLPETAVVNAWGGRVVLVPYLRGRSTTAILEEWSRS
ncbi:D-glycero-beta-D-manno-heptose 1-phosphate adenylyltransferase [Kribbella sp. NPDC051620]|uniref:D-glycero-beta-D-manno-heptose 1-phosphate adenylyltransferase n=1 Tax=Kribbella sp. NPDC051620 TaxID=3364120 RepID=UPI0037B9D731